MRRTTAAIGSAVFFVAAPGTVVFLIPWMISRWEMLSPLPQAVMIPVRVVGAVLVLAGVAVIAQAFVRFVAEGSGTPAPLAPPGRLVVGGLYRYVRNPMYVGVLAAVAGQGMFFGQASLLVCVAVTWVAVWSYVRWREEPSLRERFGADYDRYRSAVPGWWPRLRPYRG